MARTQQGSGLMRVKESIGGFAVPGPDGFARVITPGQIISADDPIIKTHADYLEPVETGIEQATAGPGERRRLRLPERQTVAEATKGRFNERNPSVAPHSLDPSDPNSPASTFATAQPGAGVVADDVPDEQNQAGGPKASDAGNIGGVDEEKIPTNQGQDAPGLGQTTKGASAPGQPTKDQPPQSK